MAGGDDRPPHEGVPGHHLQIGQTAVRSEVLNRWRRQGCWISGHGEGWALYAERLMQDLGFLRGPGEVLGMLDAQLLRAGRVVLDIGSTAVCPPPPRWGGGAWTYEKAWAYLQSVSGNHPDVLRFELDRYLGWAGQAPSYKVGERLWTALRDDVAAAQGASFRPQGVPPSRPGRRLRRPRRASAPPSSPDPSCSSPRVVPVGR